jgi:sarcosine oxidase subunit gamma
VTVESGQDPRTSEPDLGRSRPDLRRSQPDLGRSQLDLGRSQLDLGRSRPDLGRSPQDLRRSPLAHREADLGAVAGGVRFVELPFLSMVSLRVDPGSEVCARVERALGLALPPAGRVAEVVIGEVEGVVAGRVRSVLWLGPDEWLVIGPDGDTLDLVTVLDEAVGEGPGSVVDVSANRATLVLSGPNARDLLEKGCTLDLHPRSFTAGQCAQTGVEPSRVLGPTTGPDAVDRVGNGGGSADISAGPVYRLLFRGSFADYFADWLTDAATEFSGG